MLIEAGEPLNPDWLQGLLDAAQIQYLGSTDGKTRRELRLAIEWLRRQQQEESDGV